MGDHSRKSTVQSELFMLLEKTNSTISDFDRQAGNILHQVEIQTVLTL